MKPNPATPPCAAQRPRLAQCALDGLSPGETRELREHLEGCPGCRRYWEEMNGLCRDLQLAAETLPDAQAGESFHRELRNRIRHASSRPTHALWPGPGLRRMLLPSALAAACVALALFWLQQETPQPPRPGSPLAPQPALPASAALARLAPTWNAYQRIANASLETLDDVISRQALVFGPASPAASYALSRREVEE